MAKKRKPHPPPPEENPSQDENELTSVARKEINATLDMIIQSFGSAETSCEDADQEEDDSCETGDSAPDRKKDHPTGICPPGCEKGKKPGCIIPPPLRSGINLFLTCVDIFIFELDEEVIEKLILCAIVSMSFEGFLHHFKRTCFPLKSSIVHSIEKQLDDRVANIYNQVLLQVMSGVQTAGNKKDYIKTLFQSNLGGDVTNRNILDLVTANLQNMLAFDRPSTDLQAVHQQLDQLIRSAALGFLFDSFSCKLAEFQKAVGLKITCVEADLTFLSTEIIRLTSANAGILQAANALVLVASARFAEEKNYDEIFRAVEEIADVIEDLAEIYQDRLQVLRALLPFSTCPRPLLFAGTEIGTESE